MRDSSSSPIIPSLADGNLFGIVDHWVAVQPDALLFAFLDNRGEVVERLTYLQFSDSVDSLAGYFRNTLGADPGDRILLCYQPGLELITALFACNKAGYIGVPVLPLAAHQVEAWLNGVGHILDDSQAAGIAMCGETWKIFDACDAVTSEGAAVRERLLQMNPQITTGAPGAVFGADSCPPCDTFFLQYTSGSTTAPKGVVVSHGNLIANAEAVVDHPNPVTVSWLPQHHDMGLIGYYISIVLSGGTTYGIAPRSFINRPALWLETITKYRATASSIPNFALQLCLNDKRVPEASLDKFDLSSLRFLMVAAEPVNAEHFFAFRRKFAVCGLDPESLFVAYGLAEFTLAVSNYGRRSITLNRQALARGIVERTEGSAGRNTVRLMSCGRPLADTRIEIVNPEDSSLVDAGSTGEVWLSGRSKPGGYWNNTALTREVFEARVDSNRSSVDRFLRTGDIGFMDQGELFICGRIKDMLIVHGRNIYPHDIENEVQRLTRKIRVNSVVAFAAANSEAITVLAELVRIGDVPDAGDLVAAIRERLQIPVSNLVFLAPRSIARTSSGKIKRAETRQLFEQGLLRVIAESRSENTSVDREETTAVPDEIESLKQRYQLTGHEDISLLDAGIDSLDLIVLLHWLKDRFSDSGAKSLSDRITVRLFGVLTVRQIFELSRLLTENRRQAADSLAKTIGKALNERVEEDLRRMKKDSVYERSPAVARPVRPQQSVDGQLADILLTGGTGFLGPFLLLNLLQQTEDKIHVLVRGKSHRDAERRLRRHFIDTIGSGAPTAAFDRRVRVVCGDVAIPRFGLPEAEWERLAGRIGTIYHNAALVNYLLDYEHMRSANVDGTRQIIDFAFTGRNKILNHISTTFVFGWATKDVLYESDRNAGMNHLDFGYSQSKWVSEQLVFSAMMQGLKARVFRPALITPALDGRGGNLDIALRLLAFMVRHGVSVDTQNQVSFMPVDTAANNIVAIACQPETIDETFHVTREQPETMPQITAIISEETGIDFNAFGLDRFVPEVIDRCTSDDQLFPLLDFLVESVDNIAAMKYKLYDNSGYLSARNRSPSGISDASLDDVVAGIISFMARENLLPRAPRGQARARQN